MDLSEEKQREIIEYCVETIDFLIKWHKNGNAGSLIYNPYYFISCLNIYNEGTAILHHREIDIRIGAHDKDAEKSLQIFESKTEEGLKTGVDLKDIHKFKYGYFPFEYKNDGFNAKHALSCDEKQAINIMQEIKHILENRYPNENIKVYVPEKSSGGCYIATAVYGSYDCPEVWTLRRFRDKTLAETWYGRLFIRFYYAVSPTAVKYFGNTKLFKNLFRKPLDKFVNFLNRKGFEDTPYYDKQEETK